MRNVRQEVQKAIQNSVLLKCEKTRVGIGKRAITFGRYRTAVPTNEKYAMFLYGKAGNNDRVTFSTAIEAAEYFVDYVGRDIAWESLPASVKNRSRG